MIRMVPNRAVLRAAEDLCAEATAAVGAYNAHARGAAEIISS
jgi:hypothetical protein